MELWLWPSDTRTHTHAQTYTHTVTLHQTVQTAHTRSYLAYRKGHFSHNVWKTAFSQPLWIDVCFAAVKCDAWISPGSNPKCQCLIEVPEGARSDHQQCYMSYCCFISFGPPADQICKQIQLLKKKMFVLLQYLIGTSVSPCPLQIPERWLSVFIWINFSFFVFFFLNKA